MPKLAKAGPAGASAVTHLNSASLAMRVLKEKGLGWFASLFSSTKPESGSPHVHATGNRILYCYFHPPLNIAWSQRGVA